MENKIIIENTDLIYGAQEKTETVRILSFVLNQEYYCVDIGFINEVIPIQPATKIPGTPSYVAGAFNLRGKILTLLDISHFLSIGDFRATEDSVIVVAKMNGKLTAFLADTIKSTEDIELSKVQPPLSTLKPETAQFTKGQIEINGEIYIFLDLEKLLYCDEIETLRSGS